MQNNNNLACKIIDVTEDKLIIEVPRPKNIDIKNLFERTLELIIKDKRTIKTDQRKKIYAVLADIAEHTGYTADEAKIWMKYKYYIETGCKAFSLSDTDVTTARHFLQFIIEFCLWLDMWSSVNLRDIVPSIDRYVYVCLKYKKCCICGVPSAEIHHVDRVGTGRNRYTINHIGMEAMSLCRKHHSEVHTIGQKSFDEKYHIYGIKIDTLIAKIYRINTEV